MTSQTSSTHRLDNYFDNYLVPCINRVGAAASYGKSFLALVSMAMVSARLTGVPYSIGAIEGTSLFTLGRVFVPLSNYLGNHYGPKKNQIHANGESFLKTATIAGMVLGPPMFAVYCGPTILNTVASLFPKAVGSWMAVEPIPTLSVMQMIVFTVPPLVTELVVLAIEENFKQLLTPTRDNNPEFDDFDREVIKELNAIFTTLSSLENTQELGDS